MRKKKIIPLVIITFSVLVIISTSIFTFKTREKDLNVSNNGKQETTDKIIKDVSNDDTNIETDNIQKVENTESVSESNEIINSNVTTDNGKSDNNNESDITTAGSAPVINNGSEIPNEEESKEDVVEATNKEDSNQDVSNNSETSNNDNETVVEESKEDTTNENIQQPEEEYLKIKASCEFFTRSECQAALTDIQIKYLDDEHDYVSASCKSFAYKGEIVGYRVLLTYGDGVYFYNN